MEFHTSKYITPIRVKETELRDHLFRLMMCLELSEMALRLSLARAMAHSNLSIQSKYQPIHVLIPNMSEIFLWFCGGMSHVFSKDVRQ